MMDNEELLSAIVRVELLEALILTAAQASSRDVLSWLKDRATDHIAEVKDLRHQALLRVVELDGSDPVDSLERDDLTRLALRADNAVYAVLGAVGHFSTSTSPP